MQENVQAFTVSDNAARRISTLLKDEHEADNKFMRVAVEGAAALAFNTFLNLILLKTQTTSFLKKMMWQ